MFGNTALAGLIVHHMQGIGNIFAPRLDGDVYVGSETLENPIPYSLYDTETGEPLPDENYRPYHYVTPKVVSQLATWRNVYGRPWSTVSYEGNLTIGKVHHHSIRSAIGQILLNQLYQGDPPALLYAEMKSAFKRMFGEKWEWSNKSEWLRENVSEYAEQGLYDPYEGELFAWYTAPSYVQGSLPREIENVLELAARGKIRSYHIEKEADGDEKEYQRILGRLLESLEKARQEPDELTYKTNPPLVGHNIRHFLYVLQQEKKGEEWRR